MIDQELEKRLESIEKELRGFRKDMTSVKAALLRGLVYGAGYVLGAVLVVVIIGWILNIVGVIPVFNDQVAAFRDALNRINTPVK